MPSFSASRTPDAGLHAEIRSAPVHLTEYNRDRYRSRSHLGRQGLSTAESDANRTPFGLETRFIHPVALWVGAAARSGNWDTRKMKKLKQIPGDLLESLLSSLAEHIKPTHDRLYRQMVPHNKLCVARYVVDGIRAPDEAQERRACQTCALAACPCALVQDVSGIRHVVFLPLRGHMRVGKKWNDKEY